MLKPKNDVYASGVARIGMWQVGEQSTSIINVTCTCRLGQEGVVYRPADAFALPGTADLDLGEHHRAGAGLPRCSLYRAKTRCMVGDQVFL